MQLGGKYTEFKYEGDKTLDNAADSKVSEPKDDSPAMKGEAPKASSVEEKTEEYPVPIYANAEKDNGLYGYTDKAREEELSITVAARGTIGFTAIRREPFLPVVRLITVVPDTEKVSVRYLYYVLKNCKPQSSGTSIPQLTVPDIKNIKIEI